MAQMHPASRFRWRRPPFPHRGTQRPGRWTRPFIPYPAKDRPDGNPMPGRPWRCGSARRACAGCRREARFQPEPRDHHTTWMPVCRDAETPMSPAPGIPLSAGTTPGRIRRTVSRFMRPSVASATSAVSGHASRMSRKALRMLVEPLAAEAGGCPGATASVQRRRPVRRRPAGPPRGSRRRAAGGPGSRGRPLWTEAARARGGANVFRDRFCRPWH